MLKISPVIIRNKRIIEYIDYIFQNNLILNFLIKQNIYGNRLGDLG